MNKLTSVVITGLVLSLTMSISTFAKDDHEHHKKDKSLPPGLQKKLTKVSHCHPVGRKTPPW